MFKDCLLVLSLVIKGQNCIFALVYIICRGEGMVGKKSEKNLDSTEFTICCPLIKFSK